MNQPIEGSVTAWAVALGIHRDALKRRLFEAGIKFEAREDLTAKEVFDSFTGDKDKAMARKLNADADARERDNRKEAGELFELPAIEKKLWMDFLQPARLLGEQMAEQIAGLCNPQEPDTAKKVLHQWWEKFKTSLKMEKPPEQCDPKTPNS
jgi:hypothetical protein